MSRDTHSYDPHDAGETRDTSTRRTVRQQQIDISLIRGTAGIERQRGPVAPMAPRLGSSIRLARNAMILRAPITSEIGPISSAIPR